MASYFCTFGRKFSCKVIINPDLFCIAVLRLQLKKENAIFVVTLQKFAIFSFQVYASSELERRPTTKYINVNSLRKSKIGKFVLTKGKVSSPGYPFNYPGGVLQTIVITSPRKTNIVLNFQVR